MTLDLVKIAGRLPELVERARRERAAAEDRAGRALDLLRRAAARPDEFERRIRGAETSWTLALPHSGRMDRGVAPPPPPLNYAALAVDGSSIDVDRNLPISCYVLNFGWMRIQYGADAAAHANTDVELEPTGEELYLRDADDPSRESAIAGAVLGVVRGVRELAKLAELAEQLCPSDRPLLALVDGNLALWNLDKRDIPARIAEELKTGPRGALQALNRLRTLTEAGRVVFSGYVSHTGAGNLAHSLRLLACPAEPRVVCRACPGRAANLRPCDEAGLADDAELMRLVLDPWERSAVFKAHSSRQAPVVETWYEEEGHEIVFFYLNAGGEIARVELPVWMAEDPVRLDLLHALLVQQARQGGQYPVALQEAHEQAVISTGDRASFTALIARECELSGIPWLISSKALSKQTRVI